MRCSQRVQTSDPRRHNTVLVGLLAVGIHVRMTFLTPAFLAMASSCGHAKRPTRTERRPKLVRTVRTLRRGNTKTFSIASHRGNTNHKQSCYVFFRRKQNVGSQAIKNIHAVEYYIDLYRGKHEKGGHL
jgi:hypothetical protein